MAETLSIPAGTFANLDRLGVDSLALLYGECHRRAAAAESGSRSWKLWIGRMSRVHTYTGLERGWSFRLDAETGRWFPVPQGG